jgi:hypothetical protein
MSDPQTELELRLGRVAANGQAFETTVSLVLTRSLNVANEAGSVVAGELGVAKALRLIELLARLSWLAGYTLDATAVTKWVKQAKNANEDRNGAIHEQWAAHAETGEFSKTSMKHLRGRIASLAELDAVATTLREATEAGQALLKTEA